jgi:hypothetical protein
MKSVGSPSKGGLPAGVAGWRRRSGVSTASLKGNRDGAQQTGRLLMRGLNIIFRFKLRPLGIVFAASLVWILAVAVAAQESASNKGANQEPITPLENPSALDPSKVALGESLFKDPILSGKNNLACSSCHDLERTILHAHRAMISTPAAPSMCKEL